MNMQTNQINSLLSLIDNSKKSPKIKSIDFLFHLLKNIDDKDLIKELILKSNLPEEEKNILLKKFDIKNFIKISLPHNLKNTLDKPSSLPDFKQNIKKSLFIKQPNIPDQKINSKNENHKKYIHKNIHQKDILSLLINSSKKTNSNKDIKTLEETILTLPQPQQLQIVKEIKQIIKSHANNNQTIQTLTTLKEFKNATNIKDIIDLTKKFHLNLKKIIFQHEKTNTPKETKFTQTALNAKLNFNTKFKLNPNSVKHIKKTSPKENKEISIENLIKTSSDKKISPQHEKITPINSKKEKKEDNSTNIANSPNIINNLKQKIISAKQTIKHFVSNLKEAVENYKPPVTKLTLELHPKEIGKVEVIIKQRGENLQIQITSNNQTTINFLTSQQQELKNNLVNMGFTNINMNFNTNDQNKKQNHHEKQNNLKNPKNDENEELIIDFTYKYA